MMAAAAECFGGRRRFVALGQRFQPACKPFGDFGVANFHRFDPGEIALQGAGKVDRCPADAEETFVETSRCHVGPRSSGCIWLV